MHTKKRISSSMVNQQLQTISMNKQTLLGLVRCFIMNNREGTLVVFVTKNGTRNSGRVCTMNTITEVITKTMEIPETH